MIFALLAALVALAPLQDEPPDVPSSDEKPAPPPPSKKKPPPASPALKKPPAAVPVAPFKSQAQADEAPADEAEAPADSYTPPPAPPAASGGGLSINGYVDLGFARARGDGTSFAPNDFRIPADYGVDAFAPAVNSRGDVASTDSSGRFTNGFLPRSLGIGPSASFFVSTVDLDVKYQPGTAPVLLFTRLQVLPRFTAGTDTRLVVEQAFVRVQPLSSQELALFAGKFDPVFGIEYLENEANLRSGITPSLIARYTTGQELGLKAFYRFQLPAIWSALSANAAATNGSSLIESLQPADTSLTGGPVLSGRLGYELNLPSLQVKLGASGMFGPRNDQHLRGVQQSAWGFDVRATVGQFSVAAELVHVAQDPGDADKVDGLGAQLAVSGFAARGGYLIASFAQPLDLGALHKLILYGRYGRRYAQFEAYTPIAVDRFTFGLRVDLWDSLAVKGELLINRELFGAPQVDNDVLTSSLVYSW